MIVLAGVCEVWASNSNKPNLVVIFTDDQTYRAIGYNNPDLKTPNLDQLAKGGLILNHAYTASPICAASRAAMMSGEFPQQNGVTGLDKKQFGPYYVGGKREDRLLAKQLKRSGYHCAFWGKSHIGAPSLLGFDEGAETKDYDDKNLFTEVDAFINRVSSESKPFFLWMAPKQPHVPLYPEQKWLDLYDENALEIAPNFLESPKPESINNQGTPTETLYRDSKYVRNWRNLPSGPPRDETVIRQFTKAYYATISHLDQQVGDFVQSLKKAGLYENTVIMFLADNGYHLGNHGLGNKITMHEESVRVPMFIHWSGLKSKGEVSDALVSSLDVYPTLLDFAGLKKPDHAMGHSLMPILENPKSDVRKVVFSECVGVGGKFGEGHRMARSKNWKYVLTDQNEEYFFDQHRDVFEMSNCIKTTIEKGDRELISLKQAMKNWMHAIGDRDFPYEIQ